MKRIDLIRKIENAGGILVRHGASMIDAKIQKQKYHSRFQGIKK
jgi:hypothetical protein